MKDQKIYSAIIADKLSTAMPYIISIINASGIDSDLNLPDYVIAEHVRNCFINLALLKTAIDRSQETNM